MGPKIDFSEIDLGVVQDGLGGRNGPREGPRGPQSPPRCPLAPYAHIHGHPAAWAIPTDLGPNIDFWPEYQGTPLPHGCAGTRVVAGWLQPKSKLYVFNA